MSFTSSKILSRDSTGRIRSWFYEVDGDKWRGHSGIEGEKITASGWKRCKPKNVGKKNERTGEEQAAAEAEAELRKKLDREYRRTEPELDGVPPAPMLAQKFADLKQAPTGPVDAQPKLDGIRMLSSRKHGLYSREYQPFGWSVEHIDEALQPLFDAFPGVHFDGELYNHLYRDNFNVISSMVRTEREPNDAERVFCRSYLQYHVYDVVDQKMAFRQRSAFLAEVAERFSFEFTPLVLVPTTHCETAADIDRHREWAKTAGYEGQIIRNPAAVYEPGVRSWSLIKDKEKCTEEFPITRLIMGEGNWDGIPKAIEYILPGDRRDTDGNRPKASIKGTMEFCRTLVELDPKFATIEYFALTPAGIPRFPVAVDFHKAQRND